MNNVPSSPAAVGPTTGQAVIFESADLPSPSAQSLHDGTVDRPAQSPHDVDDESSEKSPFLAPLFPRFRDFGEQEATSSVQAPGFGSLSLAHTLLSLFQSDDELSAEHGPVHLLELEYGPQSRGELSGQGWLKYFSPLWTLVYYKSLLHLLFVNFFYGLLAWTYLLLCTTTGLTLLAIVPLGIGFCYIGLLGARVLARGEIAIQSFFYPDVTRSRPNLRRPIFTRMREPLASAAEIELGIPFGSTIRETSFYQNARTMFVDKTSYHALLYFLIVKPVITLFLVINFVVFIPISFVLVFPAPFVFRASEKLGIWQANIAMQWL